ncbi:hypothetical protein GCM10009785_25730 [Brooklawnia cerclae]|uniref:Cold shock CspA family protein n=1 Tax=Brooklawnia cerclae TaxID=349934 RepID=A0ABX0SDR0_9ACTN|nr:cold shock domain-containing protein [Brooklawnia cerclae]NIH55463.1 cold shock CspA family protein [Brooklawnia cerclae]
MTWAGEAIVESWNRDEGWGVLLLGNGERAWAHFSMIRGSGFRALAPGQRVAGEFERRPANYPVEDDRCAWIAQTVHRE